MRTIVRVGCAFVVGALVGGCATKYQDMGFTGGVVAEQIMSDTYRIEAHGNGYTSASTIQDYALLKAAETTKAAGGTHFLVVSGKDTTDVSVGETSGVINSNRIGNTVLTTYTPGSTYKVVKPGQETYIRVLHVAAGQTPPPGAISADEIIRYVGPRVQRDDAK